MANNILEHQGYKIGKSIKEDNCKEIINKIFSLAKVHNCNIFYPIDVCVGKNFNDTPQIKNLTETIMLKNNVNLGDSANEY